MYENLLHTLMWQTFPLYCTMLNYKLMTFQNSAEMDFVLGDALLTVCSFQLWADCYCRSGYWTICWVQLSFCVYIAVSMTTPTPTAFWRCCREIWRRHCLPGLTKSPTRWSRSLKESWGKTSVPTSTVTSKPFPKGKWEKLVNPIGNIGYLHMCSRTWIMKSLISNAWKRTWEQWVLLFKVLHLD